MTLPIREERLGPAPAGERSVHDGKEVDTDLPREALPGEDEPAVVVEGKDEVEGSDEGEVNLPHDVDLPELVRGSGGEALDRLDRRETQAG